MRAFSISYGDISSFTRSPIVRRIKRLRIFPEICASTRCSFASATRNIVPGRTDRIVPSTSIAFSKPMFDWASRPSNIAGGRPHDSLPAKTGVWPTIIGRARALFARARFVDRQSVGAGFLAVDCRHGGIGFSRVVHRDECKAAGLARHAIHHQRYFGDFAVLFEKILKIVLGGLKGEISYIEFHCDLVLENNCQLQSGSR